MGLSDIISSIFPDRKYIQPRNQNAPLAGDSFPRVNGGMIGNDLPQDGGIMGNQPPQGFYPGQDVPPQGNIDGKGPAPDPFAGQTPYPTKQPNATPDNAPTVAPTQPVDLNQAYQENGGTDLTTPSFFPNAKAVKPATAQQAAFEEKYKSETPEEKQQDLIQGKAPVDHSFIKRLLKGAARGYAAGGLGGAIVGSTAQGFFPSANREGNAAEELPKVSRGIATKNQNIETQQKQDQTQAQIDYTKARPGIEQGKLDARNAEIQNRYSAQQQTYNRLIQNEKDRNARAGNKTQVKEVNGYLFRVYPNDPSKENEPIIDPRTGKQAFNPANIAQQITFDDGTTAWAKGGQIVSGKLAGERQDKQIQATATENDKKRQFTGTMESLKTQARLGFEQLKAAQGEKAALQKLNQSFVNAYTRKNGHPPNQQEIDQYVTSITTGDAGQEPDQE